MIDLRSDTVTRPSDDMRRAMAAAQVGDDVYGDDPTVNRLQERCAELTGKEAALFVATGSLGNLVSLAALADPGEEILCDGEAHFLTQEAAGVALLGLLVRCLPGADGALAAGQVARAIRPGDDHAPRTAVVVVENPHTTAHVRVLAIESLRELAAAVWERGVAVHLDGARIFNAQVATGVPVRAWAGCADTITFCFSKGLGAPAGSMVCGSADAIARARVLRKRLGGAMRQAGVLAAAAEVALEQGVERLAEDHARARRLAEGIAELVPGAVDPAAVQTNIVYVDVGPAGWSARDAVAALREEGVLANAAGTELVRLLTHRDVDDADIDSALSTLASVLGRRHSAARS
jgi:threonine aldolase